MAFKLIKKEIKSVKSISNESFIRALLDNHIALRGHDLISEEVEVLPVRNIQKEEGITSVIYNPEKKESKSKLNKDILVDDKSIPNFYEEKINIFDDVGKSRAREEVISDLESSIIKTKIEENIVDRRKRKKT